MNPKIYVFVAITFIAVFLWGVYPLSGITPEEDFDVNPEYFSGILGASSILFGLWMLLLETKPEQSKKPLDEVIFETSVEGFFLSLSFLIVSVITIALTAVDLFSPVVALFFNTCSFV